MKILFAHAINTVASELLAALIDKEPVLICRFGTDTVSCNIDVEQSDGYGFQSNLTIPVAFAEYRQCFVVGIKIVQIQCCDFSGPGAGVIQQL